MRETVAHEAGQHQVDQRGEFGTAVGERGRLLIEGVCDARRR